MKISDNMSVFSIRKKILLASKLMGVTLIVSYVFSTRLPLNTDTSFVIWLVLAVNDPSTNLIGVEMDGDHIRTILSGDELAMWRQTAVTLPSLYEQRETAAQVDVRILERPDVLEGVQYIFVAMTLIVLSAFVSALIGLFIGHISDGMMVGVVCIKIVMIVFMAIPLLKYLAAAGNKVVSYICYLIPSSATFEGIMDLANGGMATAGKDMIILAVHCVVWFLLIKNFLCATFSSSQTCY